MLDVQTPGVDRLSDGYVPEFDIDREVGLRGELHTLSIRDKLARGSVEVKTDERALTTGNVFVEYRCKRRDGWQPSGIAVTTADAWAFVIGDVLIAVPTDRLKALARVAFKRHRKAECTLGSHPTKGVLISLTDLIRNQSAGDAVPS